MVVWLTLKLLAMQQAAFPVDVPSADDLADLGGVFDELLVSTLSGLAI
jgi:hypothetical protein